MVRIEARKEDLKFAAVIIGGSLLFSFATILAGSLIALNESPVIVSIGVGVTVLGWGWVAGTVGVALMIRARMRQLYGTLIRVSVRSGK